MQQHLTPQELTEHFTLVPHEQALLAQRSGINKLGIAVLLKYFQWEGRFPTTSQEIPQALIQHLAETLGVAADRFTQYDLEGRMARYHKEEIRHWTGWRSDTIDDAETIQTWVEAHTRVEEATLPQVLAHLTARYKHLKIDVPTPPRLERLAHAVVRTVEEQFFTTLTHALSPECCQQLETLLTETPDALSLPALKTASGRRRLASLEAAVAQLQQLQGLSLPQELLAPLSTHYLRRMKLRVAAESLHELRRHPTPIRYAFLTLFCHVRTQELTDHVIESLLHLVHKMDATAEKRVDQVLLTDFKRVTGKPRLLFQLAEVSLAQPEGQVQAVIYPVVGEQTLRDVVAEGQASGATYRDKVHTVLQNSYSHHYRRLLPQILSVLTVQATNAQHQPMLPALELLRQYAGSKQRFYKTEDEVPLDGVIPRAERSRVVEQTPHGQTRVHRINYEIAVLQELRERLRCKEMWVPGAQRYRNPDDDLPPDCLTQRPMYYQALAKPLDVETFIADLQHQMTQGLQRLDMGMPENPGVKILQRPRGWIRVSPCERQPDPPALAHLKTEVLRRWPVTSLLDILKETDLRIDFTSLFTGTGTRMALDRESLQRRLLLCLFGLGTNTGLKRVCATMPEDEYHELLYIRRRYLHPDALRNAIAHVANAIFRLRAPHIWGEGTTACASDAKHFGAWDQNLLTEWHVRYGGRGVMVYWHVEKRAVCIYSQLKTVSSSEVATMLEGLLRHGTEMPLEKNYVDSHGQSEVAFAFCHLLNCQLLSRLKGMHRQKLYRPTTGQPEAYPHLQDIFTRPMRWDLIRQHYEAMIQYATALRLGTADAETILKRFPRSPFPHPTYHAVVELGKVMKTIFLCQYLQEDALRREMNDGLQVIENWNSANDFIFYGKGGEIATNRLEDQELAVLALHLLQIALVYINTLMLQHILAEQVWWARMTPRDL